MYTIQTLAETIPAFGSIANAAAILAGGAAGLAIGARLPERLIKGTFDVLGMATLVLGLQMAMKTQNLLLMVCGALGGTLIGECLDLEGRTSALCDRMKGHDARTGKSVKEGFITAALLFCTGSMAILGAIEEGLGGFPTLLLTKSLLDGAFSVVFAVSLGFGVLFSALPVLFYQGSMTLIAGTLQPWITPALLAEITAVGGLMLLGIGLSVLELRKVRVLNMLPALPLVALLVHFFG